MSRATTDSLGGDLRRRAAEPHRLGQPADAEHTAEHARPSGRASAQAAAAISYVGELVDTHSPPWPFSIDSVVEALKGLGVTLGNLARSGYTHLRTMSGVTLATLVACTLILAPFLCMASAVLAIGLACCVPAVLTGLVVAWLPTALRAAWAVAVALYGWVRAPARTPTLTRAPAPSPNPNPNPIPMCIPRPTPGHGAARARGGGRSRRRRRPGGPHLGRDLGRDLADLGRGDQGANPNPNPNPNPKPDP